MVCDSITLQTPNHLLPVLILILLEYGLRRLLIRLFRFYLICLNPYSIGIWSATIQSRLGQAHLLMGLNPYSIGIWSATIQSRLGQAHLLMGLNPYSIGIWSAT